MSIRNSGRPRRAGSARSTCSRVTTKPGALVDATTTSARASSSSIRSSSSGSPPNRSATFSRISTGALWWESPTRWSFTSRKMGELEAEARDDHEREPGEGEVGGAAAAPAEAVAEDEVGAVDEPREQR